MARVLDAGGKSLVELLVFVLVILGISRSSADRTPVREAVSETLAALFITTVYAAALDALAAGAIRPGSRREARWLNRLVSAAFGVREADDDRIDQVLAAA